MAWRRGHEDQFPAPLREFREEDWPRVPGEHLGHYWCCGPAPEPAPEPGEECGDRCYESLARDYPDQPGLLERAKRGDAYERFHQARLNWLGEDHPLWLEEFLEGGGVRHEIRYGKDRA